MSLYPPLDVSGWQTIRFDVFNPDRRVKHLSLELEDVHGGTYTYSEQPLSDLPDWQDVAFQLPEASVDKRRIARFELVLRDPESRGTFYLDRVRFEGKQNKEKQHGQN